MQQDSFKIDCITNKNEITKIDFNAYNSVELRRLSQEQMNLLNLEKVRRLDISGSFVSDLDLNHFDSLRYIDISNTNIRALSEQLCNAESLEIIKSEHGWIEKIPDCLCSKTKLQILNTDGIFYQYLKSLENCHLLRNLNIFFPKDSLEALNSFMSIEKMKSLTHLGLQGISHINLNQRFKERIEGLQVIPKKNADIGNIVKEILTFKNLKHLEIIIDKKTFPYDLSSLEYLETLIVRRFGSGERVILPNTFYKMKKLKVIFDFKNIKDCDLDNGLSIILTNGSNYSYIKKKGFRMTSYTNPIFITHK